MSDIAERFAVAQAAALRGSGALATAMGLAQVLAYEIAPTNAAMPYVLIGDDQVIDDGDDCQDGSEIFSTVHLWSRPNPPSRVQARRMEAVVRSLLAADLAIAGHETILAEYQDSRFLPDPGGATHVVMTFRYLTMPSAA